MTQQIQAKPTTHKTPPIIVYKALEKLSFLRLPGKKKKNTYNFRQQQTQKKKPKKKKKKAFISQLNIAI